MLYAGGLHGIAGAPDSGKTTVSLYWAVQLLQQGKRVAFFDEEGGREIVAEKLISLGAEASQMNLLTYVPFPGKMWDDSDIEALMEFLGEVRPAMVLWDSSAAFLARAGLDENSAPAVTMWWAKVLTPLARDLRAAVVVIDHDTKASEQSRYARGSGAKLAASDVQYKVEIKKPFTRSDSGLLRLTVSKDRRGYLHRTWLVHMEATAVGLRPDFVHESETAYTDSWSPTKRKVWGVLTRDWQTGEEVRELIKKFHGDVERETVSRALNELHRESFVSVQGNEHAPIRSWRRCREL
jgi:AAA domain